MREFTDLQEKVVSSFAEVQKLKAGNRSAGERLRKNMQEVKNLAQAVRVAAFKLYPTTKEETK
jgi:hypothetical protein